MAHKELPAAEKYTHAEAEYERPSSSPAKSCGDCDMLIDALEPRCKIVRGPIYLNGVCKYFEAIQ